jgi:hypothetical protein
MLIKVQVTGDLDRRPDDQMYLGKAGEDFFLPRRISLIALW